MQGTQTPINQQIKKDSTLHMVAQSIIRGFDNLYSNLDKLKKKASNEQQISQINHIEDKIDNLAQKTLNQSQDLRSTTKRIDVQQEIQQLRRQLQSIQKQHEQLSQRHNQLEQRVSDLQCQMVSRQQFEQLKNHCEQKFSMFQNRFKVVQQKNDKFYVYIDDQFKRRIKPTQAYQKKLNQLMRTNYRLFQYAKKMYWSLINQILAYRALSTGMVVKGQIQDKRRQSLLFKQIVNVINSATFLITGIPFVSSIFLIVKDISSIFFDKKQDILQHNITLRIQGYYTQQDISNDVAQAVLQLINNPNIQARLNQFKTRNMIITALTKFFQFISTFQLSPQILADIFASKLTKIKKQKNDNDYITQNVITDSSLLLWKIAEFPPAEKRYPVTGAVRALFNKNSPMPPKFYNVQEMEKNMNYNRSSNNVYPGINDDNGYGNANGNINGNIKCQSVQPQQQQQQQQPQVQPQGQQGQGQQNLGNSAKFVISPSSSSSTSQNNNQITFSQNSQNHATKMQGYQSKFSNYSSTQASQSQSNVSLSSNQPYDNHQPYNNQFNQYSQNAQYQYQSQTQTQTQTQQVFNPTSSIIQQQPSTTTSTTSSTNNNQPLYQSYYTTQRPPYFKLKILRADLSIKKQIFGRMNPYCIIKYRNKLLRTQINKGGDLKPIWTQQFIFQTSQIPSSISIEVYDKERLLKDDLLGIANIMDLQLDKREQEIQLWKDGRSAGKLYVLLAP